MRRDGPTADGLLRITTAPLALPSGLRDLLPPRSARRRARARAVLERFASWGYQLVVPPAYEREESIARGLSARARRDLVRFVEPGTGEVVALRPDMTPQIARIAATRYASSTLPLRFMYEGSVLRTPRGRTRRLRQIAQAGVELLGWGSVDADFEVISVALTALSALGLTNVKVELSHAAIARSLVELAPEPHRDLFVDALGARDLATIERILGAGPSLDRVRAAVSLAGDAEVLSRAEPLFATDASLRAALQELRAVHERLDAAGLGARVLVDLAEVRGLGYYTGVSFVLLADGVGEPLGGGGRYDDLLGEYGVPRPATGCALDLELVDEAIAQHAEEQTSERRPVLLVGAPVERARAAAALRARGMLIAEADAASIDLASSEELAHFERVLRCEGSTVYAVDDRDGRDWLSPHTNDTDPTVAGETTV